MTARQEIVIAARSFLGTRWHHQGRNRAGIDCIGLVVAVAHELGLLGELDTPNYGRIPDGRTLRAGLDLYLQPTPTYQTGDVLLMRFETDPQHVGIVSDIGIIHAYAQMRKVVEHRIDEVWRKRIVCAYSFPGVEP